MDILVRKIGNSKGMVIPARLLAELGLDVGDTADARNENGKLTISPQKKRYSLESLLDQCDESAPMPTEIIDWEQADAIGGELI